MSGLLIFSLILATFITGKSEPKGSHFVDARLYPALRQGIVDFFPKFPLLYAIPGYGYSFNETKQLGGTPILSTAGVLEVDMPENERLYLRTRSYDLYDGETWQMSTEPDEVPARQVLFRSQQRAPNEIAVTVLSEYYSLVPHTLDTSGIRFEGDLPVVAQGDLDVGLLLKKPIKRGTRFYIQKGDDTSTEPPSFGPFVQVPDDVPESVLFLADQLALGTDDPQMVLSRIEQYLALNYTYSLEVEEEGEYSEDFVTDFLFGELQGYCVHFATSFALLARLSGIPVRYATGFLVNPVEGGGPVEVTGLHAHAWPEVWLEGRGWTVWEATPALNPLNWDVLEDQWLYNLGLGIDRLTNQQLGQIIGPVVARKPRATVPPRLPYVLVGAGVALLIVILAVYTLTVRFVIVARMDRGTFLFRVRRVVRESRRRGVEGPEHKGWLRWGEDLSCRVGLKTRAIRRCVGIITEFVYGGREPRKREIRYLQKLEWELKHTEHRAITGDAS